MIDEKFKGEINRGVTKKNFFRPIWGCPRVIGGIPSKLNVPN